MTGVAPPAPYPRLLRTADITWDGDVPVSRDRGDVYFSRSGGVAEVDAVFVDGNALGERFAAGTVRCIAETGFGTGLSFLVARRRFLARAAPSARLHYVSFEHAPLAAADRRRLADALAVAGERELAGDARALHDRAPPPVAGWHRIVLDGGRVRLSLWLGDAAEGLDDWLATAPDRPVDAWFLDGFAPRLDPGLWTPAISGRLARLSAPGATLGTFSVARAVRDALAGAGFEVERVPSPTGKREVLRGRLRGPGARPTPDAPAPVTVLGAGLAGAACAAALAERGHAVTVLDPGGPAAGASGNPWAVLHPRLPLDDGPRAAWLLTAWSFALGWLGDAGSAFRPAPVLRIAEARRPARLARLAERFRDLAPELEADALGDVPALRVARGGHADLRTLVAGLLDRPGIDLRTTKAEAVHRTDAGWRVATAGATTGAGHVVVAAGPATAGLVELALPLGRMRGQLTKIDARVASRTILTGRGHLVPVEDGVVVGSTYERDGEVGPPTEAGRRENLERLDAWAALTGSDLAGTVTEEFAGVRCTTPDRAPLVGALDDGLWTSTGHASSGLLTAPLAAEAIAAALTGEPPVLDAALRALLDPRRSV